MKAIFKTGLISLILFGTALTLGACNNETHEIGPDNVAEKTLTSEMLSTLKLEDYDLGHQNGVDRKFSFDLEEGKTVKGALVFRDCDHQYCGDTLGDAFGIVSEGRTQYDAFDFNIIFSLDQLEGLSVSYRADYTYPMHELCKYITRIKVANLDGEFYSTLKEKARLNYSLLVNSEAGNTRSIYEKYNPSEPKALVGEAYIEETHSFNFTGYNVVSFQFNNFETSLPSTSWLKFTLSSITFKYTSDGKEGTWHHFAAVAPTGTRHGSKEFWTYSGRDNNPYQLTDPKVENYVNHDNFDTYESFLNMSTNDIRYVIPTTCSPVDNGDGTYTYGVYPQDRIYNNGPENFYAILNTQAVLQPNGWYKYHGELYAYSASARYWFKCEPIVWNKVGNPSNGKQYLVSSVLLDTHQYNASYEGLEDNHYANNYEHSEIRSWLNDEFYNSAFIYGDSAIQEATIYNSAITTDTITNPYASMDSTFDKVFLPCYADYTNGTYGFSSSADMSTTRVCEISDWARDNGAYYVSVGGKTVGDYWTRSPSSNWSNRAWMARDTGALSDNDVSWGAGSVRPAIEIKLS